MPQPVVRYGERYGSFMLNPVPEDGVCEVCLTFCDPDFACCYSCAHQPNELAAVLPISYSVEGEQLHHALAGYKGRNIHFDDVTRGRFEFELAAVLWRFLAAHERCAAAAAGAADFPIVTTVPSSRGVAEHPLARIVGRHVAPTRDRYRPLLSRTDRSVEPHVFAAGRFEASQQLSGEPVLLIEDTWTSGAQAQASAAVLRSAGSGPVACVVVGRHVRPGYGDNRERLSGLPEVFSWAGCALHSV